MGVMIKVETKYVCLVGWCYVQSGEGFNMIKFSFTVLCANGVDGSVLEQTPIPMPICTSMPAKVTGGM